MYSKKVYKNFKEEKTIIALAREFADKNQSDTIFSYMTIINGLAKEFAKENRKFVFIFDQFEKVKTPSIDFLMISDYYCLLS
jgi:hypothetical protein